MLWNEGDTHEGGHDEDKGQNRCTAENEVEEATVIIPNITVCFFWFILFF